MESQPRKGVIYKITNLIDGKVYVGQTRQKLRRRLNQHKNAEGQSISAIDGAIKKYGWKNFKAEVLEECPCEMLNEREKFWIEKFDCMSPKGYNLTSGGDGGYIRTEETLEKMRLANEGRTLSEETRAKISAANQGENNHFYGKKHTEESKAKMSAAQKGKVISPETRAKMSEAHKNPSPETRAKLSAARTGEKNPFYGKHHTEETKARLSEINSNPSDEKRARMSAAQKGKKHTAEHNAKISEATRGEKNPFFGHHHTEESKAKLSAANKGKPAWNKGKKMSDESREKLSASCMGRVISDETKAKLSEANSGENNPFYGKHHTPETRAKISASLKKYNAERKEDIFISLFEDDNN